MRQLTLDDFVVHGLVDHQPTTVITERSVLQAFAEYEDTSQNVYVSRRRRDPLDDVPLCDCEPRADWRLTCGSSCINRATQTECQRGHCASGEICGNQRFQRGTHCELALELMDGKGVSLVADTPITAGELVAQYVGEVLSKRDYQERELTTQRYAKHTYGMAVSADEVIDARHVGGLARFANHSCSPNCIIEKWQVGGETCCGIVAKQDILQGEEITFNYGKAFVRTMRQVECLCASANCTGFM